MKRLTQDIQRIMQALVAALLIVVLLPLFLLIALLVKLTSRGPALFVSTRIGLDERPFHIWKFRTMRVNSEQNLEQLAQENPDMLRHWQTYSKLPTCFVTGRRTPSCRMTRESRASAVSSAKRVWTNCRSCGMSCVET